MPTITPPVPDTIAAWGIGLLAISVAGLWAWTWTAPGRDRLRLLGQLALLMALGAVAARTGLLRRFDLLPPPMAVLIASVLALAVGIASTAAGRRAIASVPLATLVGLQVFRLPLELLMHRAAGLGILPPELSYGGFNYDILTGIGALALFVVLRAGAPVPRRAVWAWNLWGIWCLLVILGVAVATSPMVRAFGDAAPHVNTWVLFFPYVWVPLVLVTNAIATHVVVTRKLLHAARPAPVGAAQGRG